MPNLQHPGMDAISVSDDFTSARVGGSRKPSGQIRQRNQNARVICPNHLQQPESSDRNGTTSNLDKLLNHSPGFRMHSDFFTPSRLRFTDRDQNALKWFCRSIDFQRTANSVLTVCVSQGDNPIPRLVSSTGDADALPSARSGLGDPEPCAELVRAAPQVSNDNFRSSRRFIEDLLHQGQGPEEGIFGSALTARG